MKPCVRKMTLAMVALSFSAGCADLVAGIEDRIAADIIEGNPDITIDPGDEPDPIIPTELADVIDITNIIPGRGMISGGELIEIIGFGFEAGMVVEFMPTPPDCLPSDEPEEQTDPCGDTIPIDEDGCVLAVLAVLAEDRVPADPAFVTIEDNRVICQTPEYPFEAGPATVIVRSPDDTTDADFKIAVEPDGFTFYDPVEVLTVEPPEGPAEGGTLVTITGQGFVTGSVVIFGNGDLIEAEIIDEETLTVVTPPTEPGLYAVTVANFYDAFSLPDAFLFFGEVEVHGVTPFAGPLGGGTDITVRGLGFETGTQLFFADQELAATASADQQQLTAVTLAGVAEGPVPVRAENDNGQDTLADGFIFYDTSDDTPRVIWTSASSGDAAGGQEVVIVIGGFAGSTPNVSLGDAAACDPVDDYVLVCQTPPGTGVVDVRVEAGANLAVITGGYEFIEARVDSVVPAAGAIAGGTYVHVYGQGFGDPAAVYFNGIAARDVEVISDGELVLRTPAGEEGGATVRVETQGASVAADGLFSYINPFISDAMVDGGSIDGTLHVRVLDERGAPVPEAYVIVGRTIIYGKNYLHGFTNQQGQITISAPDLIGPQDIHAGKEGHGAFSFIRMNRDVVTLTLMIDPPPQADPLPACPDGAGGGPPLVNGTITRSKDDPFNTGDDTIMVTTTYASFGEPLPDPGPAAQLTWMGDFELMTRTGDLIVIALAGHVINDEYFDVHSMGFHPFLYTEASSIQACDTAGADNPCCAGESCINADRLGVDPPEGGNGYCMREYTDINIKIDTPLDQPLRIDLIDPPYARSLEIPGTAPDTAEAFVYYDFGYQGLHPMEQIQGKSVNTLIVDMPERLPAILGEAPFSIDITLGYDYNGSLYPPNSSILLNGLTTTTEPVAVTPLLKTQNIISAATGTAAGPWRYEFEFRPDDLPDNTIHGTMHFIYDVEYVIPCEGAFPMPQFPIRWWVFTPGDVTGFLLPVFPPEADGANVPDGQHGWQIESFYSPGAPLDFNDFDLQALLSWRSRALTGVGITTPPIE